MYIMRQYNLYKHNIPQYKIYNIVCMILVLHI